MAARLPPRLRYCTICSTPVQMPHQVVHPACREVARRLSRIHGHTVAHATPERIAYLADRAARELPLFEEDESHVD